MKRMLAVWVIIVLMISGCCDLLEQEAEELESKSKKCETGDTCVTMEFGDNCIGAFQCVQVVNEKKLSSFRKNGNRLIERFEHCNRCTQAGCRAFSENEAYCDADAGVCKIRYLEGN